MPWQRKLGRPTDQRKAMLRGLVTSLIQHERIETTETRAKEIVPIADKLITCCKMIILPQSRKVFCRQ